MVMDLEIPQYMVITPEWIGWMKGTTFMGLQDNSVTDCYLK
jgi:hypothetical protein